MLLCRFAVGFGGTYRLSRFGFSLSGLGFGMFEIDGSPQDARRTSAMCQIPEIEGPQASPKKYVDPYAGDPKMPLK